MTGNTMTHRAMADRAMAGRTLPLTAILSAGIGMGFAGDHLLRASAGPGLNVFLLFVGLAASIWIVGQSGESPLSGEASSWIGVGLLCGADPPPWEIGGAL